MQEFNIKGKITAIAEVKTQMENSPLVTPPPKELQNEKITNVPSFIEAENLYADTIKENTAIMKEFGNTIPGIITNLKSMGDIVAQTNQSLALLNNNKTTGLRTEKKTVDNEITDISNIKSQKNNEIVTPIISEPFNYRDTLKNDELNVNEKTIIIDKEENQNKVFPDKIKKEESVEKSFIKPNENESTNEPLYKNYSQNVAKQEEQEITREQEIIKETPIEKVINISKEDPLIFENNEANNTENINEPDFNYQVKEKNIFDNGNDENNSTIVDDNEKNIVEKHTIQEVVERQVIEKPIISEQKEEEKFSQIQENKEDNSGINVLKNVYNEEENAERITYIPEVSKTENTRIIDNVENGIETTDIANTIDKDKERKTFFDPEISKIYDNNATNEQKEQTIFYPQETNEPEDKQNLVEAENDVIDSLKNNTTVLKEFDNVMPQLLKNLSTMSDIVAQSNKNLPAIVKKRVPENANKGQLAGYGRQEILGLLNTGNNTLQSLSGGNIGGAGINIVSGAANTVDNMSKMAKAAELAGLSSGLLAAGGAIAAGAAVLKGGKALADSYKEAMPTIFDTGKAFGTTDTDEAFKLYQTVNRKNTGTNLDIDSFNSVVQSLRKQGVAENYNTPINQAAKTADIAQTTSRWAYATGGNVEQYAELAGIMSRYGKSQNVAEDFNYLVAAGKASGLNDTQIPEFLSSIKKVMEDGIAKGFTRSATEVADTLLMFSKMSGGNEFWKGEQGTRLLSQANSGISSATSLAKTEDILVYRAMQNAYRGTTKDKNGNEIDNTKLALGDTYVKNGGYVNTMQLIEKGINAENFDDIMESLNNAYADNTSAKIEALRKMTGLNYTGAARLLNLDLNSGNLEEKIKNVTEAPENLNNETRWQKDLNNIAEALQKGGKPLFQVELKAMDSVSTDVKRIADFIIPGNETGSPISDNNKYEQELAENGQLSEDYFQKKEEATNYAEENFTEGQQVLLREQTEQGIVDTSGSNFKEDIDYIESRGVEKGHTEGENELESMYVDLHNETMYEYDSPVIRETKKSDLPKKLSNKKATSEERNKWFEENPYIFENKNKSKDYTYEGMFLELTNEKIKEIMPDSGVSMADLIAALNNPKYSEAKEAAEQAVQPRSEGGLKVTDKEIENMNQILIKILGELQAGINITANQ